MREIKNIVVHCSATRAELDIGAEDIDAWHKDRGWSGIGYHFVIRRSGVLEPGRPVDKIGAHVRGHNGTSIGICLVGGLDKNGNPDANYTVRQYVTLAMVLHGISDRYPDANILGHRDFDGVGKACPCFDVQSFVEGLSDIIQSEE